MNTRYFCAYHAERIRESEPHALRCWVEMMRRGMQAYTECRIEAAQIYLGSALDIGLLRHTCAHNTVFGEIHLTKPADFIIELRLSEADHEAALSLLNKIADVSETSERNSEKTGNHLQDYINKQRARREFSKGVAPGTLPPREQTLQQTLVYH